MGAAEYEMMSHSRCRAESAVRWTAIRVGFLSVIFCVDTRHQQHDFFHARPTDREQRSHSRSVALAAQKTKKYIL